MARRGFVTLSIGSPGGDARRPAMGRARCQPLVFLAHVAANCASGLVRLPEVDAARLGIVGHSYGGKWALFAMALDDRFACGVWSDPGIVWDETRPNVNYWEPWYLGWEGAGFEPRGMPSAERPRAGAYRELVERGHDLHELMAVMAPRPFLVSGGSEDPPERLRALEVVKEVYRLVGTDRSVRYSTRPGHDPTPESNAAVYEFLETTLAVPGPGSQVPDSRFQIPSP